MQAEIKAKMRVYAVDNDNPVPVPIEVYVEKLGNQQNEIAIEIDTNKTKVVWNEKDEVYDSVITIVKHKKERRND